MAQLDLEAMFTKLVDALEGKRKELVELEVQMAEAQHEAEAAEQARATAAAAAAADAAAAAAASNRAAEEAEASNSTGKEEAYETLLLDSPADGVLRITLNRPQERNAINRRMRHELLDVVERGDADDEVRVMVIRGGGTAFCAGYDEDGQGGEDERDVNDDEEGNRQSVGPAGIMNALRGGERQPQQLKQTQQSQRQRPHYHTAKGPGRWARQAVQGWFNLWDLATPLICQVHGYCLSGGTELAAGCDLVYTAADAQFAYPPVRTLSPPDMQYHPWFMGMRAAMEMVLTGDAMSGTEAVALGFANRALPAEDLDRYVVARASRIASIPRELTQLNKRSVHRAMEHMGIRNALRAGTEIQALGRLAAPSRAYRRLVRQGGTGGTGGTGGAGGGGGGRGVAARARGEAVGAASGTIDSNSGAAAAAGQSPKANAAEGCPFAGVGTGAAPAALLATPAASAPAHTRVVLPRTFTAGQGPLDTTSEDSSSSSPLDASYSASAGSQPVKLPRLYTAGQQQQQQQQQQPSQEVDGSADDELPAADFSGAVEGGDNDGGGGRGGDRGSDSAATVSATTAAAVAGGDDATIYGNLTGNLTNSSGLEATTLRAQRRMTERVLVAVVGEGDEAGGQSKL